MAVKKTVRGSKSRSGGRGTSRARGERSNSRSGPPSDTGGAGSPASVAWLAGSGAPRSIPAESAEALAQAERDKKGTTRPGYVRRDLATTATFNDVTYQAGENREIPEALARHIDLSTVAPDSSTEANRKTRFGGGKENDQDAQGKAIKSAREGAPAAQRKHQSSDAFAPIAGQKKSGR